MYMHVWKLPQTHTSYIYQIKVPSSCHDRQYWYLQFQFIDEFLNKNRLKCLLSIHEPFLVGAKFILDDIDTSFPNPADEMLFWDACHMIKLIRGYLHKEGTMTDPDGNVSSASEEHFMIFSPHQRSDGNAGLHFCGKRSHRLYCMRLGKIIYSPPKVSAWV